MKTLLRFLSLAALMVLPLRGQQVYQNMQAASGQFTDNSVPRRDGTANRYQTSDILFNDVAAAVAGIASTTGNDLRLLGTNGIVYFSTGGTDRWVVNASGAFNPIIDNTYDIGNGTVNPRDVHAARSFRAGAGTAAAPSSTFTADTTKGWYSNAANELGASIAGGLSLRIATDGALRSAAGTELKLGAADITATPSGAGIFDVTKAGATTLKVRNSTAAITLESSATTSDAYTGTVTNHPFRIVTNNANRVYVTAGGNTLLGGLAVDGTGVLQLPTHTAATGGIGFGTADSLYTSAANVLAWNGGTGDSQFQLRRLGAEVGSFIGDGANLYITAPSGDGIIFRSSGTTALTLDPSQNATFVNGIKFTDSSYAITNAMQETAVEGLALTAKTGSSTDFGLFSPAGSAIYTVPTGTVNSLFAGTINNATAHADVTSYSGASKIFSFSSNGAIVDQTIVKGTVSAVGPIIAMLKSRATNGSADTAVDAGDTLAEFDFAGADGSGFITGAQIIAVSEGTIGANRVPAKLMFKTGTNASPTVLTTALTLDSSQVATFGSAVFSGSDLRAAAASAIYWSGRSVLRSSADGLLTLLNNAETGFTRLQFGGTSASEPAIARSTEYINIVDATGGATSGLMINSTAAVTGVLTAAAALDFPSTIAGAVADLTITVTGAADGDVVDLGAPNGSRTPTAVFDAWVSGADTVTVRYSPKATEDPASGTFRAQVTKF